MKIIAAGDDRQQNLSFHQGEVVANADTWATTELTMPPTDAWRVPI